MARLTTARSDEIDAIYRESYALWGAGLTFDGYRAFWVDLNRTTWAEKYLTYRVWQNQDDTVLSSLKQYRPSLRLFGREGRATGIGAVFTLRAHRRRGHASAMLGAVLDEARERGDIAALLFTDIGAALYRNLGFREFHAEENWGELGHKAPDPPRDWTLRPMTRADLEAVARVHEDASRHRPIAVLRDLDYWEYLLERSKSFFRLLDASDLSRRFQVAMRDGEFAGYLVAVDSGDVWIIREVAAAGLDQESLSAILRTGASQARSRGLRRAYGWLDRSVAECVPEWKLRYQGRRRSIPMLLPLEGSGDLSNLDSPNADFIPYLDQF